MSYHLVSCAQFHEDSEDGWLVVGADSAFSAAVRALDYYWPKWEQANVRVLHSGDSALRFSCTRNEDGVDFSVEVEEL